MIWRGVRKGVAVETQPKPEADPFAAPFGWRRLFRIPAGIAVMVAGFAFGVWVDDHKGGWVGLIAGAVPVLYGAALAWEATLLAVCIWLALVVHNWMQTASLKSLLGAGAMVYAGLVAWMVSAAEARALRRITHLEERVNELTSRLYWHENR